MITFAVKVLGTAPGWRHLSGKLTVEMRPRLLHAARRFCIGSAEALAAELPVGLEIAEDPPCASGRIRRVLRGTWVDVRSGETVARTIGAQERIASPSRIGVLVCSKTGVKMRPKNNPGFGGIKTFPAGNL